MGSERSKDAQDPCPENSTLTESEDVLSDSEELWFDSEEILSNSESEQNVPETDQPPAQSEDSNDRDTSNRKRKWNAKEEDLEEELPKKKRVIENQSIQNVNSDSIPFTFGSQANQDKRISGSESTSHSDYNWNRAHTANANTNTPSNPNNGSITSTTQTQTTPISTPITPRPNNSSTTPPTTATSSTPPTTATTTPPTTATTTATTTPPTTPLTTPTNPTPTTSGDTLEVYTDGAFSQGHAAIGVWFGENSPLNISERAPSGLNNNGAEVLAAVKALEKAKSVGAKRVKLYSDSQYLIDGMNLFLEEWKKDESWTHHNGHPVAERELFEQLDQLKQGMEVQFVNIKGHSGIRGNEEADRLAAEAKSKG